MERRGRERNEVESCEVEKVMREREIEREGERQRDDIGRWRVIGRRFKER